MRAPRAPRRSLSTLASQASPYTSSSDAESGPADAAAGPFLPWNFVRRGRGASRRHTVLPVSRSIAYVKSFSSSTPVKNRCSALNTGDEWPALVARVHGEG